MSFSFIDNDKEKKNERKVLNLIKSFSQLPTLTEIIILVGS